MSEPGATPVRDAASIILLRRRANGADVLMGQRGSSAAFMPDKFVFPGGAVDPADLALAAFAPPHPAAERALAVEADPEVARALPLTAIRELWEETGLRLGAADPAASAAAATAPAAWRAFLAAGLRPRDGCAALRLPCRHAAGTTEAVRRPVLSGRSRRAGARLGRPRGRRR